MPETWGMAAVCGYERQPHFANFNFHQKLVLSSRYSINILTAVCRLSRQASKAADQCANAVGGQWKKTLR